MGGWVKAAAADIKPAASVRLALDRAHPEGMASDGLQPDDIGYAVIPKRMDAAVARIGIRVSINAEITDAKDAPQVIRSSGQFLHSW